MHPALAILPWISVDRQITVGPLRLLPYVYNSLPGDLQHARQFDIDGVFAAYANNPGNAVRRATILEFGDWQTGQDVSEVLPALFRAREALAFSALAARRLFCGPFHYCNFDTYTLAVHRFKQGTPGTFSFSTRRRDGGTTHLWSADEFSFRRPAHVDGHATLSIDEYLLSALLRVSDSHPHLLEAVREYDCANTDSQDIPPHVEVVMLKSAFERLLGIDQNAQHFRDALSHRLKDFPKMDTLSGPLLRSWKTARPHEERPLRAWAREFCDIRGAAAHGQTTTALRFVWSENTHLAFASILFPLLLKKVLADENLLSLDTYDIERLLRIDDYILHDPFTSASPTAADENPWSKLDDISRVCAQRSLIVNSHHGR